MKIHFSHRCLSMLMVMIMLFTMTPSYVLAEEVHDHDHDHAAEGAVSVIQVDALSISASASATYVYAGEEAVTVTAKISGGLAPYTVSLQAVKNGSVVFTDTASTDGNSVKLSYTPAAYGDYELVVTVHDAAHSQDLTTVSLAVAEHDMENEAAWAASVSGASVSADWGKSLLSVAKTQIGYKESEKDFVLKSGEKQGYSRYGAWYGTPYASWNVSFLAFVAEYAKIPNDALLSGSSYRSWVNGFSAKGAYMKGDYTPKAGDIAFLSGSRVAVVESVSGANVTVIEGDVNGAVTRKTYAISKVVGFGNTALMQGLHNGTATAVPTAAPEATKAPEGNVPVETAAPTATPVATPVPEEEELVFQATPTPAPGTTPVPKDDNDPLQNVSDANSDLVGELDASATAIPVQFSDAYYLVQGEMHALMEKYFGTATPTEDEIVAFVEGLELADVYYAKVEIDEIGILAESLGIDVYTFVALEEREALFFTFVKAVNYKYDLMMGTRASGTFDVLKDSDGNTVLTVWYSGTSGALQTDGSYLFTAAKGTLSGSTTTIKITNTSSVRSTLTFTYAKSGGGDVSGISSSPVTIVLAPQEVLEILLTGGGFLTGDGKLKLSGFSLTPLPDTADVKIYPSSLGNVSVEYYDADGNKQNAEVLTDSAPLEVKVRTAQGVKLSPAPNAGTMFMTWVDPETQTKVATNNNTLYPEKDSYVRIQPLFTENGEAVWDVDGKLYVGLNNAITTAQNTGVKKITLAADGVLLPGEYTIPSGYTVLIPFDDANTLYTTSPASRVVEGGWISGDTQIAYATPTAYRTLTMAKGATLTVNGSMSLSAEHHAGGSNQQAGCPSGPVSFVRMEEGSNITVNGTLYAWGFITGSGTVTVSSGANVYENFQFMDFRGGSATTSIVNGNSADKGVFPLNQYYVQNIEVPMTLYAGATEHSYTTIFMNSSAHSASVPFIGSGNSMFSLTAGYVTKWYDGSTDRLIVTMGGTGVMSISPIAMTIAGMSIESKNYELPIQSNITVNITDNSTVHLGQDIAMLPGSKIIVEEGSVCSLGDTNNVSNIYIYDADEWAGYASSTNKMLIPVAYAPGRTNNRTTADLVDVSIEVNGTMDGTNGLAYTTTGGANIFSSSAATASSENPPKIILSKGAQTVTKMISQSNTTPNYVNINITMPPLRNADGSSTLFPSDASSTITFVYVDGTWKWQCYEKQYVDSTTGETVTEIVHDTTTRYENAVRNENGDWVPTSCSEPAVKIVGCTCKGYTTTELEPATLPHTPGDAATCTTPQVCTVCNAEINPALGHTYTETYTCVDIICDTCGEVAVQGDGDHKNQETIAAVAPTCQTTGLTEGKKCSDCGTIILEQQVDPVIPCDWVGSDPVPADCNTQTDGYTVYTCSMCKATENRDIVEWETTHIYEGVQEPASCTEGGYTTYTCSKCGDEYIGDVVAALGHAWEDDGEYVPATCVAAGYQPQKCTFVDENNKACPATQNLVNADDPATGLHDYSVVKAIDKVEAVTGEDGTVTYKTLSCTEDGSVTYVCSMCNEATETVTIKAPGHQEIVLDAVAATCTATGLTEGKKCSVCGTVTVPQDVIGMIDHDYQYDVTPPTCEGQGVTVTTCKNCNYKSESFQDPTGHNYVEDTGHEQYKAATCTEDGVKVEVCKNADCPTPVKTSVITKLGHDYESEGGTVETEPTCSAAGYITKTCQREGCTAEPEVIAGKPATGIHDQDIVIPGTPATCTTAGTTDELKCSMCNRTQVASTTIDALGHDVAEWTVTPSTCVTAGTKTGVCGRCGESVTEALPLLDHSAEGIHENRDGQAPTCIEKGYSDYTWCTVCKIVVGDYTEIPATGQHDKKTTLERVEPDCTTTGLEAGKACSMCGAVQEGREVIPSLHDSAPELTKDTMIPATCYADGHDVGSKQCPKCLEWIVDVPLKKADHVRADAYTSRVEATCEADAYEIWRCKWYDGVNCTHEETVTYEGTAHGHDYTETAQGVTKEGDTYKLTNCLVAGSVTYTCTYDNTHTYTVTYDAKEAHTGTWTYITDEEPTCQEAGREEFTCTVCPWHEEREVGPLDHTDAHQRKDGKNPHCTADGVGENGYSSYTYCSICDLEIGKETIYYEPTNRDHHSYTTVPAQAATCDEDGWEEYEYCTVCGSSEVPADKVIEKFHQEEITITEAIPSTCTTKGHFKGAKYCEACDTWLDTIQPDLVPHSYTGNVVEHVDATCYSEGYTTTECKWFDECGTTDTETISKVDHQYDGGVSTDMVKNQETGEWVPADCTVGGTVTYTCTVVGCPDTEEDHSYVVTVEAKAEHSGEWNVIKAANCQEIGSKDRTCTLCGVYETAEIEKVIHTEDDAYTVYAEKMATCMEPGHSAYKHCNICNLDIDKVVYEVGTTDDHHDFQLVKGTPAECEKTGLADAYQCVHCKAWRDIEGNPIEEQPVIPTIHSGIAGITEEITVTCYRDGHAAGSKYCSVCKEWFDGETTPATDCVVELYEHKDATCTEAGYTTMRCKYYTGNADECDNTTRETLSALGHEWTRPDAEEEWTESKAASCYEKGIMTWTCECGEKTTKEIDLVAHTYDQGVPALTTTKWNAETEQWERCQGADTVTYTCTVCPDGTTGHTMTKAAVIVDHTAKYTSMPGKAPTCANGGEDGYTDYFYCEICGIDEIGKSDIPFDTNNREHHKYTTVEAQAATCDTPGWEEYEYCTVCGTNEVPANKVIPADHTGRVTYAEGKSPTCYADGYAKGAVYCEDCGVWVSGFQPKKDHVVEVRQSHTDPTCYADGVTVYQCEWYNGVDCTETRTEYDTNRPDHVFTVVDKFEGVKETADGWVLTNCVEDGYVTYKCANPGCTATETTDYKAFDQHQDVQIDEAVAETCTETGLTEGSHCEACDTILVEQEIIEAIAHKNAIEKTVAATCYSVGHAEGSMFCPDCNTWTVDNEIPVQEHKPIEVDREEATCTEAGEIFYECEWYNGTDCTNAYSVPVDALGHEWERDGATPNYQVDTPATCYAEGLEIWTCCDCTETTSRQIAMLDHDYAVTAVNAVQNGEGQWVWAWTGEASELDCTVDGSVTYKCQNAGCTVDNSTTHTYTVTVSAPGHTWDEDGKAATCTEPGYGSICTVCGANDAGKEIDPLGHDYVVVGTNVQGNDEDGWTLIDCTVAGYVEYTCKREGCTAETTGHYIKKTEGYEAREHTWSDWTTVTPATCTAKGSETRACEACTVTDQRDIAVTDHPYGEELTLDATCGEDGKVYQICTACSDEKLIRTIPATGEHTWELTEESVGVKVVDGKYVTTSCTENGTAVKACTGCNATETETVIALGHQYGSEQTIDATCGEDGKVYQICTECEAEHVVRVIDATGDHTYVMTEDSVGVEEVVDENGEVTYKATNCANGGTVVLKCSVCQKTETITIEAKAHVYGEWTTTVEPKCDTKGEKQRECANCDYIDVEELPKLGHDWETVPYIAPVCGTAGQTGGIQCSRCGEWDGDPSETIDALEHVYDNGVITTQPTCLDKGVKTFTCTQKGCTASIAGHSYTEEVDALQHNYNAVVTQPTCLVNGYTTYTCTRCEEGTEGHSYIADVVNAKGVHTWDNGVQTKAPTCVAKGETTYTCTYKYCDVEGGAKNVVADIDPTGAHNKDVLVPGTEATCTEAGLTDGYKCSVCGNWQEEQEPIPAIHDTIKGLDTAIDSTCTTPGHDVGSKYCEVCETWFEDVKIDVKQHAYTVVVEEGDATCYTDAYVVKQCTWYKECGKEETFVEENSKLGCDWEVVSTDGVVAEGDGWKLLDCTIAGSVEYRCKNDASHTKVEPIAATGHRNTAVIPGQAVTCEKDGYEDGLKCTDCNTVITERKVIKAEGHVWDNGVVSKAPTCTEMGDTTYTCTFKDCDVAGGAKLTLTDIDATGHDYEWEGGKVITEKTCLEDGKITYICKTCKAEWVDPDSIDKAAGSHTETLVEAVAPTCGSVGYSAGVQCSVCNEWTVPRTETPKLEHTYDSGVITTQPTCVDKGVKTFTCTQKGCTADIDGHTKTEEVDALGHKYDAVVTAPTCNDGGYTTYTCKQCEEGTEGHSYVADETDALGHDYDTVVTAPTCTEDGYTTYTCKQCEEGTEGHSYTADPVDALGHDYDAVVTAPTCTEDGYTTYTCTQCKEGDEGHTYTADPVDALGHKYTTLPAKAATCTESGLTAGSWCDRCELVHVEQKTVEAKGHTKTDVAAVAPTCTETGKTAGVQCSVCKEWITEQETVPATGHTEKTITGKAATCTAAGLTDGVQCSVCNTWITEQEDIPAKGHTEEDIPAVAPTCTAVGKTAGKKCTVCGIITVAQTDIPATGHTEETIPAVAPTCTEAGKTAGVKCSVCNTILTEQKPITATGHTEVIDAAVAPTCTDTGLTEGKHCSVCNTTLTAQTVVDALGHTETILPAKAPTCTETGLTEGAYCYVCNTSLAAQEEVPANGHKETVDPRVEPTCTETGKTAGSHCSVCNEILVAQEEIPANGHVEVTDPRVEPTCTETGKTEGSHCETCGEILVAQKTINAKGHTTVTDPAVDPTCTETGKKEGSHCSVCSEILVAQEVIPALGHDEKIDEAVAATCTESGLSEGVHCERCSETLVAQEVVPALGHDEKIDEAIAATCTETGKTEGKHCERCSEILVAQEETPALGHSWNEGEVTKDYTCTEAGILTKTCQNGCGETVEEPIKAAHRPVIDAAVEPTCTTTGLTEGSHCEVCNEVLQAQEELPAAHTWETVEIVIQPTCTENGERTVRCTVSGCGAVDTLVIPALGHTEVIDPKVDETCDSDGLTEGKHCSVCGKVLVAQKTIEGGHLWSKEPCLYTGATCSRCKETNADLLEHNMADATCEKPSICKYGCGYTEGEALGHTEIVLEAIPPMCDATGLTEGKQCTVCGAITVAQKVEPARGHLLTQYTAKNPTFTSEGWNAYEECSRCGYTTKVSIPAWGEPTITSYTEFMTYLPYLEQWAMEYARENPGTDPVALVIKYIRTGVDRYNSGSWGIMAGYEDAGFAKFVAQKEDEINAKYTSPDQMIKVSGLKNLTEFTLPNGDRVDIGHMFGTMDITYHNKGSVNHADVGGWAGDLVDLLSTADHTDHADVIASAGDDFEALVTVIREDLLGKSFNHADTFSMTDIYGDLDAFYVMDNLDTANYEAGDMTALFESYFTPDLDDVDRAEYLLTHRLNGASTRSAVREAVYTAYTSNSVISTLEGTREFNNPDNLDVTRQAVCYAFADYLCELAGDYVDTTSNQCLNVFESSYSTLAPGITMEIHKATTTADGKQMVYYLAYADVGRDDVHVIASYQNRYPEKWGMSRVLDQANGVQELYGNPENAPLFPDEEYVENFNVIAGINGAGYDMGTGEPGGLLVMHGRVYHPVNGNGFFGIHKDGYAVIGTTEEWNTIYYGQIDEAVAGFGTMLVKDGEIVVPPTGSYYNDRASRTAIGITRTGKVVFMVLDGRQEPWSCGGSMAEIAEIMKNAGCVQAINLDGGGSTTFVARKPGSETLSVVSKPSDGAARSVSTGLLMISTAPSSTKFDHALVEADYAYLTIGAEVQMRAKGLSATGNVVDLPTGTRWEVSDDMVAYISDTGVLVGLDNGTVDVYLKLGETTIGQKTMHVVVPDQLYFTKAKVDSVYGSSVELPLRARYEGKEVAITADDISFTLSDNTVGTMEGMKFVAVEESKITTVSVTATLVENDEVDASIQVILYKQGENSFDFDRATGGDRLLAWQRTVSNSYTADNSTYYIVDPEQDMVTTYVLALDMTQIPIPQRLNDLIYMLPGHDMEGACAWTFLLQLAERISVLTTVRPEIHIDPNFTVDYSEVKLVNDYFTLDEIIYDEENNTLTLVLHWIDQTQPIPEAEANPLCMVTGLKLIPKPDAQWTEKDQLKPIHSGKVSYEIYMRASSLYTFCQKPENQATFGLKPFVNPNLPSEKGGYFEDTYITFSDTYTLVKALKNGWYNEDGGFRYYVDGVYHTGVQNVEGLFYDFGTDGINVGKKTYTGKHVMNGITYYIQLGEIFKGWVMLDDAWHLFHFATGAGIHGDYDSGFHDIVYQFENGRLLSGVWYNDGVGLQYYYGPYYYKQGWKVLDGKEYFFENYYAFTGVCPVQEAHAIIEYWYEFSETGAKVGIADSGFYEWEGKLYYVENYEINSLADKFGLYKVGNYYYYADYDHSTIVNQSYWVGELNGLPVTAGTYRFDEQGRMIMTTGVVDEGGTLYYYENGRRINNAGVIEFEGNYYNVGSGAICFVDGSYWVSKTNGLVPEGTYRFNKQGHMIMTTEVVDEDGTLYYYKNGKRTANAGLVKIGDGEDAAYYYIGEGAKAIVNSKYDVVKTNGLVPSGIYRFGADGKADMDTELAAEDGKLVYYEKGKFTKDAGLVAIEGDYYYIKADGTAVVDAEYEVTKHNNLLPAGIYRFDEEGKAVLTTELVEENGEKRYYVNGALSKDAGLILYEGAYYYINKNGVAEAGKKVDVVKHNNLLPAGIYRFAEDATAILTTELANEDGTLYYYKNGRLAVGEGLIKVENDYYYIDGDGKAVTSVTMLVEKTNGYFPQDTYEFGADGKMVIYQGIVNGYYYVDGVKTEAGLVEIDGEYYYAGKGGKIVTDQMYEITKTNDLLPAGVYDFDEDGKIIMHEGLTDKNGTLYYFENGMLAKNEGLIKVGEDYYYIGEEGFAETNVKRRVDKTNGLVTVGVYRFGEDGKMIRTTELVQEDDKLVYYIDGMLAKNEGLILYEGAYYYIGEGGVAATSTKVDVKKTNDLVPAGIYRFGDDSKGLMETEVAEEDGLLIYYENGKWTPDAGLVKVGDDYYFIGEEAVAAVSTKMLVEKTNGYFPVSTYEFGADGKMVVYRGIVNGYYYVEGVRTAAGLIKIGDDYYYAAEGGKIVTGKKYNVVQHNDLLPGGYYRFDAEGKAIIATEIVPENGKLAYYNNGLFTKDAGLVAIGGDYYYVEANGYAVADAEKEVTKTNGLLPEGTYRFDEEGKAILTTELVEEDGEKHYYVNGMLGKDAGLIQFNGDYYYIDEEGTAVTDSKVDVVKTNGLLPEGTYRFDEEGKAVLTTGLVEEDGKLYYYEEGRLAKDAGLIELDGDYYYIDENGAAVTDTKMLVEKTNGLKPEGTYCFGDDGKLFDRLPGDADDNQVVDLDDALLVLEYDSTEGVKINRFNADVNGDDVVDINDALLIMQYDAGWDDVELI